MAHVTEYTYDDQYTDDGYGFQFFPEDEEDKEQDDCDDESDEVEGLEEQVENVERAGGELLLRHLEKGIDIFNCQGEELDEVMGTRERTMRTIPKTRLAWTLPGRQLKMEPIAWMGFQKASMKMPESATV